MKSRNTLILVVVLAALAVAAYFFTQKKDSRSTLTGSDSEFTVADTAAVDKIFISTKDGKNHTFTRKSKGEWELNGKYTVRPDMMNMLLNTLKRMEVKRPVSKASRNGVVKTLAVNGIKVEIYQNGELSKVFYTGGTTADELGSYFIMEDSEDPYILHIPGFNGFINRRFLIKEHEWREVPIFAGKPNTIEQVSVQYPRNAEQSFVIEKTGNTYQIPGLADADTARIKKYLTFFTFVNGEYFYPDPKKQMLDSLNNVTPGAVVSVKYNDGKRNNTVKLYPKPVEEQDRFPAVTSRHNEVMSVQTYVFDKIMLQKEHFDKKKPILPILKYDL